MYRVIVLYEQEPDAASYAEHVEVCKQVPGGVFRHGKISGSPQGAAQHAYFAEWEFADADAFKTGTRSDEIVATGKDAAARGLPAHHVEFLELN
jgi:hypothetical protein